MDPFARSLCNHCHFLRRIESKRGSTFFMCGKSKEDDRFPKYPPQPVAQCAGFREADEK